LFDFLIEPHDGPYYWDRSSYPNLDKINVPTLMMNRWSGWPIHLAGAF
jgi:predicted acyl esterase